MRLERATNPKNRSLVVASIVVNPDSQWAPLSKDIDRLISENVPSHLRTGFEFHAHDLMVILGRTQNKDLISGLLRLPNTHSYPDPLWCCSSPGFREHFSASLDGYSPGEVLKLQQGVAFSLCASSIETGVRAYRPDEKILWIADKTNSAQIMKDFLAFVHSMPAAEPEDEIQIAFEHIIDTIYFGNSHDSRFLQLADACNYVIKRHLMGRTEMLPYFP